MPLAGICAVVAVVVVMPAPAQAAPGLSASVRVQGVIAATWSGDPARGCAGAGTCGLSGSVTFNPSRTGDLEVGEEGFSFGGPLGSGPPIARAVRELPGSPPAVCTDVLQDAFYGSTLIEAFEEQVTAGFANVLLLSGGRCAGPRPLDLARALPSRSVSLRTLARGPQTIDLSGRFPFAAGSLSGTVISTVRVRIGRARRAARARPDRIVVERPRPRRRPHRRRSPTRYATLTLDYRIERLGGAIATDFSGLADPSCRTLDACGARGTSTLTVDGHAGRVEVQAARVLGRGKRPTVRSELRRLRRGRLFVEAGGRPVGASARIDGRLAIAGAPDCVDSLFTEPPSLAFGDARGGVSAYLARSNLGPEADTIRTRCAGPTHEIVLGEDDDESALAQGTIPFAALGNETVNVSMGSALPFSRGGFTGARRGAVTLDMRLRRIRVAVERVRE